MIMRELISPLAFKCCITDLLRLQLLQPLSQKIGTDFAMTNDKNFIRQEHFKYTRGTKLENQRLGIRTQHYCQTEAQGQ